MTKHNVGSLLVFDNANVKGVESCKGIITERGVCTRAGGALHAVGGQHMHAAQALPVAAVWPLGCTCPVRAAAHTSPAFPHTQNHAAPDYLTKVVVEGRSSTSTPVTSIMTPSRQLAVLTPEHSVLEVCSVWHTSAGTWRASCWQPRQDSERTRAKSIGAWLR